ncbi:hypothetical protein NX059_002492 [Plenodomus lindquistii]|nr:hypothetical protein NX059_002492 [Plenodomus lindquistii]
MDLPPRGRGRGAGRPFNTTRGRGQGRDFGPSTTLDQEQGQSRNLPPPDPGALNARYPSPPRGHPRGRNRGHNRGRARGTTFSTASGTYSSPTSISISTPTYSSVPPHRQIHPQTPVSIILKPDQASGHRVTGIVADLLTRGDHPRGVKVRLRDGRVGRVQALVTEAEGERGEALVGGAGAGLGRDGEGVGRGGDSAGVRGGGFVGGRVERDVREMDEYFYDEEMATASASLGLFGALEDADRGFLRGKRGRGRAKGKKRGGGGGGVEEDEKGEEVRLDVQTAMATCPVCGDFEGDEAAVAYHVEEHFGS